MMRLGEIIHVLFYFQSYIERGLFTFTYGQGDSVVDFVHVNNLVDAHILAGKALKNSDSIAVSVHPNLQQKMQFLLPPW